MRTTKSQPSIKEIADRADEYYRAALKDGLALHYAIAWQMAVTALTEKKSYNGNSTV